MSASPTTKSSPPTQRRLAIGAEVQPNGGVHFRVWAPLRRKVEVVFASAEQAASDEISTSDLQSVELCRESDGHFAGLASLADVGSRYGFRLDGDERTYPDPASRYQPDGPHGMSIVVDPAAYEWQDQEWPGLARHGQVMYELHLGTFTPEGTWEAARRQLSRLAELGITAVEIMPVAEFTGRFGWGYDGVNLFAPTRLYGEPDAFRQFVDEAHRLNVGVILDVVFNHFGPTGNYLGQFSDHYTSKKHHTDWGHGINFDSHDCAPVREFFIANAGYWIDEFHVDGLRLDAVQAIVDDSPDHILAAITRRVREMGAGRKTLVIAENEFQQTHLLRSVDKGGYGLDGAWNDDFHHSARVAMTGHSEYYYGDYHGTPQELVSAVKWGYLYQGQWNVRQQHHRGASTKGLAAEQFVTFLQNHDQIGNSARGKRCHELTSPGRHRALTALWLLAPGTPMFFQGQEFSASAPFLYFADHEVELGKLVRHGRQESLRQFRSLSGPDVEKYLIDPCAPATYEMCKLDWAERDWNLEAYALHYDLLRLRREDATFAVQSAERMYGAVLGPEAFALRFNGAGDDDRLLMVNLGPDLEWTPPTEPLLAPVEGHDWAVLWSSEDPRYGGSGSGVLDSKHWYFPGHAALVLCRAPLQKKSS